MTHISKGKVPEQIEKDIHAQLETTLLKLNYAKTGKDFLQEFFTDSERIMFAKRLAIIQMLAKHYSWDVIASTLYVSRSTIARIYKNEKGATSKPSSRYKATKNNTDFWETLDVLSRAGMPELGKGRWKILNKLNSK